ncbi:MAG: FkbM family methyltransferase [Bacteroidia bacterium]|jgi:FkbM family methyltransferase|nr:FkbM family methyltransferase [Bacteroidia bacterium]
MIKATIKRVGHAIFGFERFLYYFSLFKINTLKYDRKEKDIFTFIKLVNAKAKDGIILDIGANIGIMTGLLAKHTPFKLKLFEPMPVNTKVLAQVISTLKIGQRTEVYQVALGNYTGTCTMILPVVDKVKMHGLSHVFDSSIADFNEGETTADIPITTLDEICSNEPIIGIKLDVENYEHAVLLGAKLLLTKQKPIVYTELWDNQNRYKCFEFMQSISYETFYLKNHKLVKADTKIPADIQNFFFLPA